MDLNQFALGLGANAIPPPQADPDNDPNGILVQQQRAQQLQALAQQLRQQQAQPVSEGSMVSGHYVPNRLGMVQQGLNAFMQPQVQSQADAAARAAQAGQVRALQQTLAANPVPTPGSTTTSYVPGQALPTQATVPIDQDLTAQRQGAAPQANAPTDLQGPVQPTTVQSAPTTFAEYQAAKQKQALALAGIPGIGEKLAGASLADTVNGTDYDREQKRQDQILQNKALIESRRLAAEQQAQLRLTLASMNIGSREKIAEESNAIKAMKAKQAAQGGMVKTTAALNNQYMKAAKPYGDTIDAADKVHSIIEGAVKENRELTPGEADAIAYAANKAADPTSVVREGEYARTTGMMPILDQLHNRVTGLWDGKTPINLKTAQMISAAIDSAANPSKERLYQLGENYAVQSKVNGVPAGFVVTNQAWRDPNSKVNWDANPMDPESDGVPPPASANGASTVVPGGAPMPTSHKDPQWDQIEQSVAPQIADMLKAIRLRGEKSNSDQVSSAGARTPYQIIPSNREAIMKEDGYDPWASPENAARAAARIWQESMVRANGDKAKALDYYSGGAKGYSARVLSQAVPAAANAQVSSAPAPAPAAAPSPKAISMDDYLKKHGG